MEGVLEIWAKQLLRKLKRKGSIVETTAFPVKQAVHREEDGDKKTGPRPPPPAPLLHSPSSGAVWKSRCPSWTPRLVSNSPDGLCGRKPTLNLNSETQS